MGGFEVLLIQLLDEFLAVLIHKRDRRHSETVVVRLEERGNKGLYTLECLLSDSWDIMNKKE